MSIFRQIDLHQRGRQTRPRFDLSGM
jgi:hypothetical protein